MRKIWVPDAWDDYLFWQETNRSMVRKINTLIKDCERDPFGGIGHPEPLKWRADGAWSRRINQEHRLVYIADTNDLIILQARYHY